MPRYIDADEFVKRVIQYPRQSTKTIGLALADTPTADVVEVKRGKWIWQGSISEGCWICSECNHKFYQGYGNENFCPNCGADMREETDDAVH